MSKIITPRRLARLAGVTAAAGLVAGGLALSAVPAQADTIVNAASCPVPTSVAFQLTGTARVNVPAQGRYFYAFWQATYNGKHYLGVTESLGDKAGAQIPPNQPGNGGYCYVG